VIAIYRVLEYAQAPSYEDCDGILAYHIKKSDYGDIPLDGLIVIAVSSFKGNIWTGDGFTKADEKQKEALMIFGNNFDNSVYWNVLGFALITIMCMIIQYILLRIVANKTKQESMKGHLHLGKVQKLVSCIQYVIITLFISIILQMVLTSSYNTMVLAATIGVSYTLGAIMMGYLASRFYLWFKINKNSVILAYTLASVALHKYYDNLSLCTRSASRSTLNHAAAHRSHISSNF